MNILGLYSLGRIKSGFILGVGQFPRKDFAKERPGLGPPISLVVPPPQASGMGENRRNLLPRRTHKHGRGMKSSHNLDSCPV